MNKEVFQYVDHTLLAQDSTWAQIKEICDDAIAYGTASVCIPPSFVKRAKEYVGDKMAVCTVIGFPNGYNTTAVKVFETKDAIANGADEEKIKMCELVTKAGADFIKTSTGFSKAGATFEDIKLFSEHIGESVRMKAAGGIKSFEDAEEFLRLGAKRLGTSRIVKLAKAEKEKLNGNKDTDTDSY